MAEYTLISEPPLAGYDQDFDGTSLVAPQDLALVSIALPLGEEEKALRAIKSAYGIDLPDVGRSATTKKQDARLLRLAQDQAFVLFTRDKPGAAEMVGDLLKGKAYVTDQTDVWTGLRLSGSLSVTALERICPIDLHSESFGQGQVARTMMEHLGVLVLREADDTFLLLSASSSARSFLHAVETSIENVL